MIDQSINQSMIDQSMFDQSMISILNIYSVVELHIEMLMILLLILFLDLKHYKT